jgi:hypothetical protein
MSGESAESCVRRYVCLCIGSPRHDTLNVPRRMISSDHVKLRQVFVYMLCTKHKNLRTYTEKGSLLLSQHGNFMRINFAVLEFYYFNILIAAMRAMQYLD